jgi:hypothetical protein
MEQRSDKTEQSKGLGEKKYEEKKERKNKNENKIEENSYNLLQSGKVITLQ